MLEAPSYEGAFLVSETPPSGKHRGWGTGDGEGVPIGFDGSPNLDHKNSYLAVKNLSGSLGAGWRESEYADR